MRSRVEATRPQQFAGPDSPKTWTRTIPLEVTPTPVAVPPLPETPSPAPTPTPIAEPVPAVVPTLPAAEPTPCDSGRFVENGPDRIVMDGCGEVYGSIDLTDRHWWIRIEHSQRTVVYVRGSDSDPWHRLYFGTGWTDFHVFDYTGPSQVAIDGSERSWTVTFQRVVKSDYIDGPEWDPVAPWDGRRQ